MAHLTIRPGLSRTLLAGLTLAAAGVAVNELCPVQIWQLRSSAARYRPAGP